jgi:hypothetical protein
MNMSLLIHQFNRSTQAIPGGRGNIQTYDPLPHPQTFKMINGMYGEGPVITRLEGVEQVKISSS